MFFRKISLYIRPATRRDRQKRDVLNRPKFIELIVFLRSASNLRLAKWEAMQVDAKVYFVVHGKLTTTADNNLGEVRMAELPDRILITVAKCRVRTHHNVLRFSTVSHQTVGLAQARPKYQSTWVSPKTYL